MITCGHRNSSSFFHHGHEGEKQLDFNEVKNSQETSLPVPLASTTRTTARDLKPAKHESLTLPESVKGCSVGENLSSKDASCYTAVRGIRDMEAAKAAVVYMDVPEALVQLLIDTQHLGLHEGFSDVVQLYEISCDLASDPQRQKELRMNLHEHQQSSQISFPAEESGPRTNEGDAKHTSNVDGQNLLAATSAVSSQSSAACSSICSSDSPSVEANPEQQPAMGASSGSAKEASLMIPSAVAEDCCKSGHHHERRVDTSPVSNKTNVINTEEPVSGITDTSHVMQLQERVKKLALEHRRLTRRKMCRVCKKVELSSSGTTFLPCGHFITCEGCAEQLDNCPGCGKVIMGTVRTFLS